jgi:hypothetical protein
VTKVAYKVYPTWKKNEKGKRLCPICGAPAIARVGEQDSELTETGEALYPTWCKACDATLYETRWSGFKVKRVYHWPDE